MKIRLILLLILLMVFGSCKYNDKIETEQAEYMKQDSVKIENSENEEKDLELNLVDKIDQKTIVDSMKNKPAANIDEQQKTTDNKDNYSPDIIRGLYLTAYKVASSGFKNILDQADSSGINTVVFDLKNMNGDVFFKTDQNRFLTNDNLKPIINIKSTVKTLHDRNMKVVSRLVMFHDIFNAGADSSLTPELYDGSNWVESKRRGPAWMDSSNPLVQNYLLDLISQVAKSGVDEIQLDYIRFPTQGGAKTAVYYFQKADSLMLEQDSTYVCRTKADIITGFLRRAKKICDKNDVTLAADVFAIVAWQRDADIASTGQNIKMMSQYLDYMHPMIYSSHFADNFGYRENVANEPYFILYKGTRLAKQYANEKCKVVPYIQANTWKVNYKKEYVLAQVSAINELNAGGYLLWNSSNVYTKTLTWLKEYYESN
jgi:hypothetical protein